jgi:formyl-CoA transferase/CoA:oxalate CoA-transferase
MNPLSGKKVLDFTRVISGPYCTMMLADMGADVVKIEEKNLGDEMRHIIYEGRAAHDQDYFNSINRSKRSLDLNLKDPGDLELAHTLAKKADVVIENFAPGVAERLGIGWEKLKAGNPDLIYTSISGFGQTGPYCQRPALDPVIQALSGVMSVTGFGDGKPLVVGAPIADVAAGMFAAFATVCALIDRDNGAGGQYLDVSMLDSMIAVLAPRMAESLQARRSPNRYGNGNPMRVPTNTYETRDGRHLMICVLNDRHWPSLCDALGRLDLRAAEDMKTMSGRCAQRATLDAIISEEIGARDFDDWAQRFERSGVPFGVVNDYMQAIDDPQVSHRGLIREISHPRSGKIRVIGQPWKSVAGGLEMRSPPMLGEHRDEIIHGWLGGN